MADDLVAQARRCADGRRLPSPYAADLIRLLADRVEALEEASDWNRLLGPARMVLDRCAEDRPGCREEAADMAQRIVDLIGHPVTDEPPHALVALDEARARVEALEGEPGGPRAWLLGAEARRLEAQNADLTTRLGEALRALNLLYEGGPSALAIRVASDPANGALLESLREADHAGR